MASLANAAAVVEGGNDGAGTAGGRVFTPEALRKAALGPSNTSSVDDDTRLLQSALQEIEGRAGAAADVSIHEALDMALRDQGDLNAFTLFVFECRFGWSERGQNKGQLAGRANGPSPPTTATTRAKAFFPTSSPSSSSAMSPSNNSNNQTATKKRALNTAADKVISLLRDVPPNDKVLGAIKHCIAVTKKPVVRKQLFIHLYEWFKSWANYKRSVLAAAIADGPVDGGGGDDPVYSETCYAAIREMVVDSVTDIWSAIRKNAAVRLYSVVDLFPMAHVEELFKALVGICVDQGRAKASSWQAKEGALLGITAIVKKFRRVVPDSVARAPGPARPAQQCGSESSGGGSPALTSSSLSPVPSDGGGSDRSPVESPTAAASPPAKHETLAARRRKKSPARLSLANLSLDPAVDAQLSPTGAAQSFNMVTPLSRGGGLPFGDRPPGAVPGPPPEAKPTPDSPSSGATLTFGRDFVCVGGLPEFIEREMRRVTYTNLGHQQLSVRENATKAFAAFLSRSPSRQTLNAFSDVIAKLAAVPIVDCQAGDQAADAVGVVDPYLAEGLLSLCVILAKLRMVPEYYLARHWRRIFGTLNKYLGHSASTVRQMSSTVFKHLAFKGSRTWGSGGTGGQEQNVTLLLMVLKGLVLSWEVGAEPSAMSWQSREGRLLTYELVIDYLLTNHSNYMATDPSRKVQRRVSSPPSFAPPAEGGDLVDLFDVAKIHGVGPRSSTTSSEFAGRGEGGGGGSPVAAPVTPIRPSHAARVGRAQPSPANSIPSPSPSPSADPWVSPAHHHYRGSGPAAGGVHTPGGGDGGALTGSDRKRRPEPRSLLMVLMNGEQDAAGPSTGATLKAYLQQMLVQTKECLADDQFELRRMADQVLPGLVKVFCWLDTGMLGSHWQSLGQALAGKDALTCRFVATSLRVALKYTIGLRNSLMTRHTNGGRRSRPSSRPHSPRNAEAAPRGGGVDGLEAALSAAGGRGGTPPSPSMIALPGGIPARNSVGAGAAREPTHGAIVLSPGGGWKSLVETSFGVVFKTKATLKFGQETSVLRRLLKETLPLLHRLARRAVTEKLFAATMEVMVIVHSLLIVDDRESGGQMPLVPEEFVALDLRVCVDAKVLGDHASIIVDRIARIHEIAHPKHPQRLNQNVSTRSAQMAAREKRAQVLDNAVAESVHSHIPRFLTRVGGHSPRDMVRLIPIVLRWSISRETIDGKCALLYAVVNGLKLVGKGQDGAGRGRGEAGAPPDSSAFDGDDEDDFDDFDEAEEDGVIADKDIDDLFGRATAAVEQLLSSAAEAAVLRAALEVVLTLSALKPRAGAMMSRVLPVIAERLRQAAPRSVRIGGRTASMVFRQEQSMQMQWLSNDITPNQDDSQHLDSTDESEDESVRGGLGGADEAGISISGEVDIDDGSAKKKLQKQKKALGGALVGRGSSGQEGGKTVEDLREMTDTFEGLRERSISSGASSFDDDESDDDWDDWDDDGGADTGNEALSSELGWFVYQLHLDLGGHVFRDLGGSGSPNGGKEEGIDSLNFLANRDMEVLRWALQVHEAT
jgi:hypothetical protein